MNIRRPTRLTAPEVQKDGPRINQDIRVREVQLITQDGENVGVTPTRSALDMAKEAGLDLVEIVPTASPPVCKIMDYGKYKYQAQKRAAEARKKQKIIEIKEIKVRPAIEKHDYEVKLRHIKEFLADGDKVKVTLRFRGREMAHQDIGMAVLHRIKADTQGIAKVEFEPKLEGRQVIMILAPEK